MGGLARLGVGGKSGSISGAHGQELPALHQAPGRLLAGCQHRASRAWEFSRSRACQHRFAFCQPRTAPRAAAGGLERALMLPLCISASVHIHLVSTGELFRSSRAFSFGWTALAGRPLRLASAAAPSITPDMEGGRARGRCRAGAARGSCTAVGWAGVWHATGGREAGVVLVR
jgi:hypothetical protein